MLEKLEGGAAPPSLGLEPPPKVTDAILLPI